MEDQVDNKLVQVGIRAISLSLLDGQKKQCFSRICILLLVGLMYGNFI